jgi:hypothetical protein
MCVWRGSVLSGQGNTFTPGEGLEEGKAGGKAAFTPDQLAKIKARGCKLALRWRVWRVWCVYVGGPCGGEGSGHPHVWHSVWRGGRRGRGWQAWVALLDPDLTSSPPPPPPPPPPLSAPQAAIAAATSAAEIDRLNFFVLQGVLPPELQEAGEAAAAVGAEGAGGGEGAAADAPAPAAPIPAAGGGDADLD